MKIYYSKFAYTIMLVCSIIMLIALSAALYVLMFKIPNIEILPKILLSLLILFAFFSFVCSPLVFDYYIFRYIFFQEYLNYIFTIG